MTMTNNSLAPFQNSYCKCLGQRLSALELSAEQLQSICTCVLDESLFGSYINAYSERYDNDRYRSYRQAAQDRAVDGELEIDDCAVISAGDDDGAYVMAWLWVPDDELPPEPGPTYSVWVAEPFNEDSPGWIPDISTLEWRWIHDETFTCDDDPDGIGARRNAHEYARYLRQTYPCAYVAVLPAGKAPKPIHQP